MTTSLIPVPPARVPVLDPAHVAARRSRLLTEIDAARSRGRRHRRRALTGGAAVASAACVAAVVAVVGGVAGPATPSAFAGWTPTPSAVPAPAALQARTACLTALAGNADHVTGSTTAPWRLVLIEKRGPTKLAILENGTARASCLDLAGVGASISRWIAATTDQPAPRAVVIDRISRAARAGTGFTTVQGTAGVGVTSVEFKLSGGQLVRASLFTTTPATPRTLAAWWPNTRRIERVLVTTSHGVTSQPAPKPGPSNK